MFEKLKTINTPSQLLEKLKLFKHAQQQQEIDQIKEETLSKTQDGSWFKRKVQTQSSQRSTWASLKTLSTSPKVKSHLDIIKLRMPSQFQKKSNMTGMITELETKRKLNIRISDVFKEMQQTPASLNQSIDHQIIGELQQQKMETMAELYSSDLRQIELLNDEALQQSQKKDSSHHNSPGKSPARKFHHHHHNSATIQSQLKLEYKDEPSSKPDKQKQFIFKVNEMVGDDNGERERYFKKYQLANRTLSRVSQKDYRQTLKSFEKMNEYANFYKQQPNLYMQLNKSSKKQQLFQSGLGLITDQNQIHKANASAMIRTNQRAKVFSEALQSPQCKTLKQLKLSQNQLNSPKIQMLVKSFPQQLQELDLMNNGINSKGCQILAKYISKSHISKINLENNKIGDLGCNYICQALFDNDYLIYLNISRNNLTDICSIDLSNYIRKTQSLYELYLHFNSLNPAAAINIWKALYKNSSIKVFDISYNRTASMECAQTMAKVIAKAYPELMHIDVSHNGFDEAQTIEIKKALESNQNIYGFHYEGNCNKYIVDSLGHLRDLESEEKERIKIIEDNRKNPMTNLRLLDDERVEPTQRERKQPEKIQSLHRFRRIHGLNPVQQNFDKLENLDRCWICEGWEEVKFCWTPGKSGGMDQDPIYVHLSFEGYKPILMSELQGEFYLYRMCPPNSVIHYFFTNPVLGIQTVAKNQLITKTPESDPLSYEQQEFLYNGNILIDGNKMNFVNEVFTQDRCIVIDKYIPKVYSKPREEDKIYDLSQFMTRKSNHWCYEISIFKNYQPDNEELIDECFEYDFRTSKIPRLIKDFEVDEIKEILRDVYPFIFNSFKLFASFLIGASLPCISNNAFIDFLSQTQILDNKFKPSDVDLNFISTSNAKDVQYPNTYEKALVRYQFMEVLVRIAIDKYYRTGICKTQQQSIERLLVVDLAKQRLQEVDKAQEWRDSRYWNEQCDMILKDRLPMLRLLFKFTSKLNSKTKYYKHTWIQFKDFRDLLNKCDLYCDTFVERDAYIAYLLSMQTQVDELYQMRHFQMEFYEFLEALARCAEKLSLIRTEEALSIEERRQEPLYKKLDALTLFIYLRTCDVIKQTLKEQDDFTEFDRCMTKKQKTLKQQIEDIGEIDEKPYNPIVEEQLLAEQLKQVIVQPSISKLPTKGMTFIQVIRQAQQQQKLKSNFNLTNIVQYFKQKESDKDKEQTDRSTLNNIKSLSQL